MLLLYIKFGARRKLIILRYFAFFPHPHQNLPQLVPPFPSSILQLHAAPSRVTPGIPFHKFPLPSGQEFRRQLRISKLLSHNLLHDLKPHSVPTLAQRHALAQCLGRRWRGGGADFLALGGVESLERLERMLVGGVGLAVDCDRVGEEVR